MLSVTPHMVLLLVAIFGMYPCGPSAVAADMPSTDPPYWLEGTQVERLHSKKVGVDYQLYVSLPRDYGNAKESYPVLLVLDADYCFAIVHQITRMLADHDEMRPVIVVGITYPGVAQEKYGPILKSSRTRDYTPTHVATGGYGPEAQKGSGGADRFLDFMAGELLPHLEKKFRIQNDRTIVGYSYGGLLASYALLTRPNLFQRYIVVSPSLWYDKGVLFRVNRKAHPPGRAFFAVGRSETGKNMVGDLRSFVASLRAGKQPGLQSKLWIAGEETHHSVFPGAAMRGIRYVFQPWRK